MSQIIIGRVLPIYKGDWNDSSIYSKLDCILYNGSSWVATATNSGVTPDDSAQEWKMIARAGSWSTFTAAEKESLIQDLVPYVDNISIVEGTNTFNDF